MTTSASHGPGSSIAGLLAAWLMSPALVFGQPAADPAAHPADARASVPAIVHTSPLARYKPLGDDPPQAWREANDQVGRIGGWRAYAREAQQPESSSSPVATASGGRAGAEARPAAAGHAGHGQAAAGHAGHGQTAAGHAGHGQAAAGHAGHGQAAGPGAAGGHDHGQASATGAAKGMGKHGSCQAMGHGKRHGQAQGDGQAQADKPGAGHCKHHGHGQAATGDKAPADGPAAPSGRAPAAAHQH